MRPLTTRLTGMCAALLLSATFAVAQSPDTNNMTIVTFSAPVSLPGVTLPAGSYMFKLADSQVNRNIVQVFTKDRSKILATILAIPAERMQTADETVITFNESPANAAPAIRYWYYPGEKRGQEFAYPKKQAIDIANAAHTSVLSVDMDENNPDSMKTGAISRVEPGAEAAAATPAPAATSQTPQAEPPAQPKTEPAQPTTPQPTTQPAQPTTPPAQPEQTSKPEQGAQPQAAATPAPSSTMQSTPSTQTERPVGTSGSAAGSTSGRKNLPKTASTLPLVGFAGVLALLSAFGVRNLRRARV